MVAILVDKADLKKPGIKSGLFYFKGQRTIFIGRFNQKLDSNLKILSTGLKQSLSKVFKPLKKFKIMHFFACKLDSIMLQDACDDRSGGEICLIITI